MATYYAIADLYGPCPDSSKWYAESAKENAVREAVRLHDEGGGPMTLIKITTERLGMTNVAFVEDKKEESE